MKRTLLAIAAAGVWITTSEFLRNELLFKGYWVGHYRSLGLEFETRAVNGILWMVWSFLLGGVIWRLLKSLSFVQTLVLAWVAAFAMMWLTLYNLQVLPLPLLAFAVPLSLIEVAVAGWTIRGIDPTART